MTAETYIQKFVECIINHLDVLDSNPSNAIVAELFGANNTVAIDINHFEIGLDECLHRLQSHCYMSF